VVFLTTRGMNMNKKVGICSYFKNMMDVLHQKQLFES
jgi:hypothetical protein